MRSSVWPNAPTPASTPSAGSTWRLPGTSLSSGARVLYGTVGIGAPGGGSWGQGGGSGGIGSPAGTGHARIDAGSVPLVSQEMVRSEWATGWLTRERLSSTNRFDGPRGASRRKQAPLPQSLGG